MTIWPLGWGHTSDALRVEYEKKMEGVVTKMHCSSKSSPRTIGNSTRGPKPDERLVILHGRQLICLVIVLTS